MKKIRDFFYNCNDIIAVLIILLAAVTLIYWRVNVILDYPATLAAENAIDHSDTDNEVVIEEPEGAKEAATEEAKEETKEETGEKDKSQGEAPEGETAEKEDAENEDAENEDEGDTSEEEKDSSEEDEDSIWKDGKLKEDVTVYIESGSSVAAVESLIAVGIFDTYEEYVELCEKEGIDPESIQTMEFTFGADYTKEDIVRLVTNN